MAVTLGDRLAKHARQKARLEERERVLKEQERRARTRTLISMGSLVDKAGLSQLDTDALYGALLTLERGVDDDATIKRWRKIGRDGLLTASETPTQSPASDDTTSEADPRPLHVVSQVG